MKKFWGAVFVLSVACAFGNGALARDAVIAPAYSWSGFYVGAHGGYLRGSDDITNVANLHPRGGFGGVQIGYWAPISANWLYGFETDISFSSADGTENTFGISTRVERFGTARTRLGYANGPWLVFASGGLAWSRLSATNIPTSFGTMDTRQSFIGWSAGLGLEYALNERWSARAEYIHASFSRNNEDLIGIGAEQDLSFGTVRVGLNYRLGALPQKPLAASPRSTFNWTGGYMGVHGGFATGHQSLTYLGGTVTFDPTEGGFGGVQGGYNWQFASNLVLGIESDISLSNLNGDFLAGCCRVTVERFGTARLRAGYAFSNVLFYGTGGIAWAKFDPSYVGGMFESNRPFVGWTAGLGVEYALSAMWSVKAEYLRFNFEDNGTNHVGVSPFDERARYDVYRIGLNYRATLFDLLASR